MSGVGRQHLGIVSGNYPAPAAPTHGTFVREFARAVTRQGVQCTVIAPVAWHKARGPHGYPKYALEKHGMSGGAIEIWRPRFVSASAWPKLSCLGRLSPTRITFLQFSAAAKRVLRAMPSVPHALYGHFLYQGGATAVRLAQEFGARAFPCVGEGVLWTTDRYGDRVAGQDLRDASGFIANNSVLAEQLMERFSVDPGRIRVFPNGADTKAFYPRDKGVARERIGLPKDQFVVGAAGNFLYEKGVHRVAEAIDGLDGVVGAFAGSGPQKPEADNIAFCGRIDHQDMPWFYSACDVFVLPTLVEGSCNAIAESMACGLPVVSSDLPFNNDHLDASMSIRIDPLDIRAIRDAVKRLIANDALRVDMALHALNKARDLDIERRATGILDFMGLREGRGVI